MSYTPPEFIHDYANRMAPLTRRQMPVFSQVGKGLQGNSFRIEVDTSNDDVRLAGIKHDECSDEDTQEWELLLSNLVPVLHYELWTGVRVIDDVLCYVYWYVLKCVMTVDDSEIILWEFDTPYVKRFEYSGDDEPPADTKIDEG